MNKIQKLVKSISWYFKLGKTISFIMIIAGIILTLFLGVWYLFGDPEPFKLNSLEVGGLSFLFTFMFELEARPALLYATLMCLFASVAAVIEYLLYGSVCSILEPIREGRPFQDTVAVHTKRLGWLTIASGITAIVTNTVLHSLLPGLIDLSSLFASDKVLYVGFSSVENDISFIIYALVLFLLSAIFRHGSELQQLSDETL